MMNFTSRESNIIAQILCGILLSGFFLVCLYYFIKYANILKVIHFVLVLTMIIILIVVGIILFLKGIDSLLSPPDKDNRDEA